MRTVTWSMCAALIGALTLIPVTPSTARADDDDWEDRWEDWEDRWEDYYDDLDDDDHWRHSRLYRNYGYRTYYPDRYYYRDYGHRGYHYDYPRGHRIYRYYDGYPRRCYGGHVHAGPADVYYGRHGEVRVGPFSFYW